MTKTAWAAGGIVLILIALVVTGGYLAIRSNNSNPIMQSSPTISNPTPPAQLSPAPSPITNATVEVDLKDTGFDPQTITIKKGDTINFVNKSTGKMWVASNPHPTHTDYPGFDQLASSDSYSFTFDKTGTWDYHDHLKPSFKGSVVVKE